MVQRRVIQTAYGSQCSLSSSCVTPSPPKWSWLTCGLPSSSSSPSTAQDWSDIGLQKSIVEYFGMQISYVSSHRDPSGDPLRQSVVNLMPAHIPCLSLSSAHAPYLPLVFLWGTRFSRIIELEPEWKKYEVGVILSAFRSGLPDL